MSGRLLLHMCCAPDAALPWPALLDEGFEVMGFFYGNNIHPESEWKLRTKAVRSLAGILGENCEIAEYNPNVWFELTRGYESSPEGGGRCAVCFDAQLGAAADFASRNGYGELCTTLTISPHKNHALINEIGESRAAVSGLKWIKRVWRKNDGFKLSTAKSKEWGLYRQNYCGCAYSARNGNGKTN